MITKYPKIFAIGKDEVKDVFRDSVVIEEKVDGSQLSFGVFNGVLVIKSRGAMLDVNAPEKMFKNAVSSLQERKNILVPEHTYRGEYLSRPRHNAITYDKVPDGHVAIFDINDPQGNPLAVSDKHKYAEEAGFSHTPILFYGDMKSLEELIRLASGESFLGGSQMEGVVIKNYFREGWHHPWIFAKYVNDNFKEVLKKPKSTKPGTLDQIIESYRTDARWQKAIQHLEEEGLLNGDMSDIPQLMKAVNLDVLEEDGEVIKERLFKSSWKEISRGIVKGLPQYYKKVLEARAFEEE